MQCQYWIVYHIAMQQIKQVKQKQQKHKQIIINNEFKNEEKNDISISCHKQLKSYGIVVITGRELYIGKYCGKQTTFLHSKKKLNYPKVTRKSVKVLLDL
eukprot:532261_1